MDRGYRQNNSVKFNLIASPIEKLKFFIIYIINQSFHVTVKQILNRRISVSLKIV